MLQRPFNHWDTLYRDPPITKIHYIETLQSQRYMLQRPSNHWDTLYRDPPITICYRDPPITEIHFIETVQSLIYVIETLLSLGYTLQAHSTHQDTHGIETIHYTTVVKIITSGQKLWCLGCLNNRIVLSDMIESFASDATASLVAKNGTNYLTQLFQELWGSS